MNYTNNSMETIFEHIVLDLIDKGHVVGNTHELRNVSFTLRDPDDCVVQSRGISLPYLIGEHVWYLKHLNETAFISRFAPFWSKLSDDGLTSNSAYGYIAAEKFGFDQLQVVVDILKADPNSRRGIVNINTPNPIRQTTKDEPCTIALQFYIRDKKLELTAIMRSSDIWLGIPYDVPYFTTLQKIVARSLGLPVGPYHHFSTSLHLYDAQWEKAREIHRGPTKTFFNALALVDHLDELYRFIEGARSQPKEIVKQDLLIRAYKNGIFTEGKA